jgi:diacylglycerol kinase (ATP)
MRAAFIFGLGCSPRNLKPFQTDTGQEAIDWRIGMPAAAAEADIVLLFGGDGTVHRHLSQLVKLGLPVLIVPSGSGNDFARTLGLRRVRDSLTAWQRFCAGQGNMRMIDLGVIRPIEVAGESPTPDGSACGMVLAERRYFCSVAGIGLDAEVTRRANALPRWLRGHGGYALALAPTIFGFAPFSMKLLMPGDDKRWVVRSDQPTLLAAFANTSTYGGGMKIAPRAKSDDGELDVCLIGGIDSFKLACLFPTVYFGLHSNIRGVNYFRTLRVRVETEAPVDVYADGEYVCRTPVEVGVQRGALKVLTL